MNRSNYFLFALALIIFLVALYFYRKSFREILQYTELINKSHDVINGYERLSNDLKAAQLLSPEMAPPKKTEGIAGVYLINAANISTDLSLLDKNILDLPNRRRLDTITLKINEQLEWIMRSNIHDSILLGKAPGRMKELFLIQNLIDSSTIRAKNLLIERRGKLESTLSLNNLYILLFRIFSFIIILSTIFLVIRHARQKEKSRAFLDSILNSSQNAIISYKVVRMKGAIEDFKIVYANEAVREQTGVDPAGIIGKTLLELSPEMKANGVFEKFCKVAETSKKLRYEVSSAWGIFDVLLAKFMDGVTASFFNISEFRRSGEELKKKVEELEQSNYELEQYAYVASHDLQEPLRKIRIFGGLVRDRSDDQLDQTNRKYLQRLIEAAERMTNLINELLKFSRLFKPEKQYASIDLNEVLQNVLKDFDLMIQEKNVEIKSNSLPVIEANPLQMNQLFYNLIHNALKFSDSKEPSSLEISAHPLALTDVSKHEHLDQRLTYFEITFTDNGIGFNQEFATQIFEIFKRLNEQNIYPGSGIGLALCRKIILKHHGIIWAEGKEKIGATFHVVLPAEQPHASA
jgi:signal transduction histidine kinase